MATYFIDIDGVLFKKGTNTANSYAVETIKYLISCNHKVLLTTKRNQINADNPKLNIKNTKKALHTFGLDSLEIIEDVPSPRYVINDEGAHAINHKCDEPLDLMLEKIAKKSDLEKKLYDSLATILWVTTKYDDCLDADEYIQTLIIAESLIANNGFNHRDLVKRYKSKTSFIFNNSALHEFNSSGVSKTYRGQIYRLKKSNNPLYLAKTGVTDGAAMKVLPIAAYYLFDITQLIIHVDKISKITHGSVEARLSAVLIALRYRQILLGFDTTTDDLVKSLNYAIKVLGFSKKSSFFVTQVNIAKKLTDEEQNPEILLKKLATEIGLDYLAWSTPISACFWSFRATKEYYRFFNPNSDTTITIKNTIVDAETISKKVLKEYENHLIRIGQYKSHLQAHGYHWKEKIDIDTFFSIAFSIVAMRDGIENIDKKSQEAIIEYGENLNHIAHNLLFKKNTFKKIEIKKIRRLITYRTSTLLRQTYNLIQFNLGIKKTINKSFKMLK
jgi:ADP-ribosylglycohydrolase